jgi:hypothetical protein
MANNILNNISSTRFHQERTFSFITNTCFHQKVMLFIMLPQKQLTINKICIQKYYKIIKNSLL